MLFRTILKQFKLWVKSLNNEWVIGTNLRIIGDSEQINLCFFFKDEFMNLSLIMYFINITYYQEIILLQYNINNMFRGTSAKL